MTDSIYWDTSAIIKLYAPEPDSADYRRLVIAQPERLAISFLHQVELYFALRGKESRGEIAVGSAGQLFQLFEQHISAGRYHLIPWSENVALEARQLLNATSTAAAAGGLRSLDGLHLGALRAARIQGLVAADLRMRQAASAAGIAVIKT